MRELTQSEMVLVSGGGKVAEGLVGVGLGSVAGLASGTISGFIWGARVGGLVGAGVGALVGIGYVLATSGGGGRRRIKKPVTS